MRPRDVVWLLKLHKSEKQKDIAEGALVFNLAKAIKILIFVTNPSVHALSSLIVISKHVVVKS